RDQPAERAAEARQRDLRDPRGRRADGLRRQEQAAGRGDRGQEAGPDRPPGGGALALRATPARPDERGGAERRARRLRLARDAPRDGKRFRFLNTHLEAFSSDIASAQLDELLTGPGSHPGTTILVCDCNSDPLNQSVKTPIGDTLPHSAPYWLVTSKNHFWDT